MNYFFRVATNKKVHNIKYYELSIYRTYILVQVLISMVRKMGLEPT